MAFGYRASISVDNTKVGGGANLSNYPVMVKGTYDGTGSEPDLKTNARSDGYDIRFYNDTSETTQYDHELVNYNSATGAITAFVRIPTLDYNDDTVFYMFYGDNALSTDPSTANTWTSTFTTVVHGGSQFRGDWSDSSQSNHTVTNSGSTLTTTDAKVHEAFDFNDADPDSFDVDTGMTDIQSDSSKTIQCWISPDALGDVVWGNDVDTEFYLFTLDAGGGNEQWRFRDQINGSASGFIDTTNATYTTSSTVLIHAVNNANTLDVYENGSKLNKSTNGTPSAHDRAGDFRVGVYNDGSSFPFNGRVEELRICTAVLTDGWITTDYNSMNSPSTFYTMGDEVSLGGAATAPPTGFITLNTKFWGT